MSFMPVNSGSHLFHGMSIVRLLCRWWWREIMSLFFNRGTIVFFSFCKNKKNLFSFPLFFFSSFSVLISYWESIICVHFFSHREFRSNQIYNNHPALTTTAIMTFQRYFPSLRITSIIQMTIIVGLKLSCFLIFRAIIKLYTIPTYYNYEQLNFTIIKCYQLFRVENG